MDFVVRPITPADQEFVTAMQYEAFFVPPGAEPFPRTILDEPKVSPYHENFGTRDGDVGFIAIGERALGAAWVRLVAGGYGYVDDATPELGVAVIAPARGRGVGTALLRAVLDVVPRCSLSTDVRNPALHLYQRFGFEFVRADGEFGAVMLRDAPN